MINKISVPLFFSGFAFFIFFLNIFQGAMSHKSFLSDTNEVIILVISVLMFTVAMINAEKPKDKE